MIEMSVSTDDLILPSSQELIEAEEAWKMEAEKQSGDSSSDSDGSRETEASPKKIQRSGILMMVNETERELKYRAKHFADPEDVLTDRKLRCTACCISLQSLVLEGRDIFNHPVLKVLMCKNCIGFYGDGDFSIDEDGSDKYCRWCGQGGTLYCCAMCCCAFCKKCIKRNFNRSILDDIESEEWKCFVCEGEPLWELRAICQNAQIYSKKIKRKKKVEQERNLKLMQKRAPPGVPKPRRLNRWQKSSSLKNSSSENESGSGSSSDKDTKCKKSKIPPSRNKRKRNNSSSSSHDGSKKKKCDSDVDVINTKSECIVLSDSENETCRSGKKDQSKLKKGKSSAEEDDTDDGKMPKMVDPEGAKEVQDLLQEHLNDLIRTGELIAYRAKRLLEKKVNGTSMTDPETVGKVINNIGLLVQLSGENMNHTLEFLSSQHKHWIKGVKKKYKHSKLRTKSTETNVKKASEEEKSKKGEGDENSVHVNGVLHGVIENKINKNEHSESVVNDGELAEQDDEDAETLFECNNSANSHTEDKDEKISSKPEEDKGGNTNDNKAELAMKERDVLEDYNSDAQTKVSELVNGTETGGKEKNDVDEKNAESLPEDDLLKQDTNAESIASLSTLKFPQDESTDMFGDSLVGEVNEDKDDDVKKDGKGNVQQNENEVTMEEEADDSDSISDAATVEILYSPGSDGNKCEQADTLDDNCSDHTVEIHKGEKEHKVTGDDDDDDNKGKLHLTDEESKSTLTNNKSENDSKAKAQEDGKDSKFSEDCLEAQKSLLLGYSSDDEDDEDWKNSKKSSKKERLKRSKADNNQSTEDTTTKRLKKRRIGPKSKTRQFRSSSSSSATGEESDSSSGRLCMKEGSSKKKKFRLKDTEAYKQDKKLGWKCTVDVDRLPEENFKRYHQDYYTSESDVGAKEDKEIESLTNLKSLKKGSRKKSEESGTEESDGVQKKTKPKVKKDKKIEQEQRLIDFFNKEDDDEIAKHAHSLSPSESETEETTKPEKKMKSFADIENEMAMKSVLGSSNSEDEGLQGSEDDESKKGKKKDNKTDEDKDKEASDTQTADVDGNINESESKESNEETEEMVDKEEKKEVEEKEETKMEVEEEEKKQEEKDENEKKEKEEKITKEDNSSESDSEKPKKKDWRKDKLLTERLTDLDTSDEERLWKSKKAKAKQDESKKKIRRRILGSDDDDDDDDDEVKISSSDTNSSDSDIFVIKRKKKQKKESDSDEKRSGSDSDFKSKKPKRRRIKAPASDSSSSGGDDEGPSQKSTPGKGRKKIHHIMSDDNVAEATRKAAKEEEERRKRIAEKQTLYNVIYSIQDGMEKLDKLILDFDPETKKELVSVDTNLVQKLKPHQAKGVKFMWDACFESLKRIKKSKGSGCILAHCMGLGKTFQIVTLVHTLLSHPETEVKTVLVLCPLSTVLNWVNEFNMWLKGIKQTEVNIFELTKYRQNYERMYQLKDWQESGGVMVLGYDMYRMLSNPEAKRLKKKAIETFQSTLVDPGPDLVVCDEGHLLKNEDSAIAKAMRRIRTLRRIILTGTPLQNNLKEYHCMVQFVKPNLLGNRKEFLNRFVNPISNGQFEDSTLHDVKIMKRRAHVLHKMLEGSVQRFDYSVLTPFLPQKHEYVISIRLSEIQVKAYRHYLDFISAKSSENKGAQLFSDFQNLQRIWTHPRVLQMSSERDEKVAEKKRLMESDSEGSLRDFIDNSDETSDSTNSSSNSSDDDSDVQVLENEENENKSTKNTRSTRSRGPPPEPKVVEINQEEEKEKLWWKQFIQGNELEDINHSGKMVLLFTILRECEKIGDKVLVFSQSLFSLNLIEYFLAQIDSATENGGSKEELGNFTGSWAPGLDYFRLDGSTSGENRNIFCKAFNREDNYRARLFIISTRAGGLGINLFAANRVIIFDASWNPSHDVQSIFRVYRFGQKKPCYIYRFLAQGTMEEKIYDRQVTKLSLACRVVDEQQIQRHYNMADLQELYQFDPEQRTKRPTPILPKDRLLAELLKEHENWIVTYHEHDSLLENKEEEELNEEERKAAWEEYENEKEGKNITVAQTLPTPGLNMAALHEALRHDNPQATEEQLAQKMNLIVGQIYDYVSNPQNGATAQYTPAHLQALQQYQYQQQLRASFEKQMRIQQESIKATGKPVAGFNPNTTFPQYYQDQVDTNASTSSLYPTNIYRNTSVDKSGVFRMHPKLVPINPNSPGAPKARAHLYKNMGSNELMKMMMPQLNLTDKFMPPPAHGNTALQRMLQDTSKKDGGNKIPVPDIETID